MKHRIAILSDIHGNTTALEAVIKDAQELGATEYWLMGDILLPGPGRNELFELLSSIPITATVRGNWDDCVLEALDTFPSSGCEKGSQWDSFFSDASLTGEKLRR